MKIQPSFWANLGMVCYKFQSGKVVIEEINNIKCDNVMTNATWLARPQGRGDDQLYGHEH